jgi:hypothetical protein
VEIEFIPEEPGDAETTRASEMRAGRSGRAGSLDDPGVQRGRGSRAIDRSGGGTTGMS